MEGLHWLPTVIASAGSASIMIVGGLLTDKTEWYRNLRKPNWQPPDWLFPTAWTAIYILVTWATILAWEYAGGLDAKLVLLIAFALNGVLNMGWSLIFFKWRRPDQALLETGPLWLSTVLLAVAYHQAFPLAGWLIAPYVAWVAIAAYLNLAVVRLNRRSARPPATTIVDGAALDSGLPN